MLLLPQIPFVKAMLGVPLVLEDLEEEDPEMFHNLTWLLHNTAEDLGLSFQHCIEYHGQVHSVPLRPGGHLETVTDANKTEYIDLLVNMRVTRPVRPQLRAMRDGFHGVLPRPVLEVLSLTDVISVSRLPLTNTFAMKNIRSSFFVSLLFETGVQK